MVHYALKFFNVNLKMNKILLKYQRQLLLTAFLGTISFNEHWTAKGGTAPSSASIFLSGFLTKEQMSSGSIVSKGEGSGCSAPSYLLPMRKKKK